MEYYTKDSLRELRGSGSRTKSRSPSGSKGSKLVYVLIVLLLLGCAVFYVKTSHPVFFQNAVNSVKNFKIGSKTLSDIGSGLFNKIEDNQALKDVFNPQNESDNNTNEAQTDNNTQNTDPINDNGQSGGLIANVSAQTFSYLNSPESADFIKWLNNQKFLFSYTNPLESGTITSYFSGRINPISGKQSDHTGIDIAAADGSDILAFADGTVLETGQSEVYGNYIIISHDEHISTFYGHLSSISVKQDEKVKKGSKIGVIGSTGWSTGTHLHFEMREDGERFDPYPYLTGYETV